MHSLRALILSFAAVAMIAMGVAVGMSRGAMASEGQFCSVTGPAPVVLAHDGLPLFDADGAPVTLTRALCLDCLVVAFDLPPAVGGARIDLVPAAFVAAPVLCGPSPARFAAAGQARAPPRAA